MTLQLDLDAVPWSRRGAFLAVSSQTGLQHQPGRHRAVMPGLYLFDLSGSRFFVDWNGILRLEALTAAGPMRPEVMAATPTRLELGAGDGVIELAWDGAEALRCRGRGIGLRLVVAVDDPLHSQIAFPVGPRSWRLLLGENAHLAFTSLAGEIRVGLPRVRTGPDLVMPDEQTVEVMPGPDDRWEISLAQYVSGYREPSSFRPFEACADETESELDAWARTLPPVPSGYQSTRDLAAYLLWSCVVGPRGKLRRPTMMMSKNWMHATWSWDHCFNALALVDGNPDLAWDQLMTPFDQQHPDGALPDIVHDAGALYGFVKPPVHGWAVHRLNATGLITAERAAELLPRLAAWTDWWFRFRDTDGDLLPEYHHGNDSGWDNATVFDMGFPATGPDLATYLVLQLEALAVLSTRAGRPPKQAARWQQRADEVLAQLIARLWDGARFRTLRVPDGAFNAASRSIIPFIPMLLGERLPRPIRRAVVEGFRTSGLLTSHGIATEAPQSPLHESDGYWRGPIWAPTTLMVVDGLRACGELKLARDIAARFLELCRRSGFPENFEAATGRPLRDPAYTWTASTFLTLACDFA